MAQINASIVLVEEFTENNNIAKEINPPRIKVDPNKESNWGIAVFSDVLFDIDEEVEPIKLEFKMLYLGHEGKVLQEGDSLEFPIVEKSMSYIEMDPFRKKIYTKRTTIRIETMFPGEGSYALILLQKPQNPEEGDDKLIDIKIIDVAYN